LLPLVLLPPALLWMLQWTWAAVLLVLVLVLVEGLLVREIISR
jgi:hypothetical protein